MVGQVRNKAEIELGDPAGEVAVLQSRCDQSHLDQSMRGAELRQQIERRGVEGRSAKIFGQAGLCFKDGDWNARVRESVRGHEPHWTRTGNEDTIFVLHTVTSASRLTRGCACFVPEPGQNIHLPLSKKN